MEHAASAFSVVVALTATTWPAPLHRRLGSLRQLVVAILLNLDTASLHSPILETISGADSNIPNVLFRDCPLDVHKAEKIY